MNRQSSSPAWLLAKNAKWLRQVGIPGVPSLPECVRRPRFVDQSQFLSEILLLRAVWIRPQAEAGKAAISPTNNANSAYQALSRSFLHTRAGPRPIYPAPRELRH